MYIGLFSNAAFVFFADNYFLPQISTYDKINIYCLFVFLVFLMSTLLSWNIFPPWFEYLEEIKELYIKKYYDRERNNLPHLHLKKLSGLKTIEDKIRFSEEEKDT